ncbi:NAD(P)-dependent oxidoreductase, partial [Roseateles sp. P5_E11]
MINTVGFVGLGAMGKRMVPHLIKAGYQVFVCDINSEAVAAMVMLGASRCETPRHVGDNAEVVLVCVPTPDIVEEVILGDTGVREGELVQYIVDHSTTGPSVARRIAAELAKSDILSLDAPLAGGVAGAEAGT